MKKFLFLFTLLLLATGGSSVWAGSHTITFSYTTDGNLLSPLSSTLADGASKTITSSPLTLTFTSTSDNSVEVNTSTGTIKFQQNTTLRITCASNASITGVNFTSTANNYMQNFGASTGSYSSTPSTGTWTGAATDILFTANKNVTGVTTIAVTYSDVLIPYSGSYPYTWVFNYGGDDWLSTTSTMLSNDGTNWQSGSVGAVSGYLNKSALSNQALKVGSDEMQETKGLKFTADANEVGTTLKWEVMLTGGASVTIPAKAGHKVEVYGYWPAQTMTLTNATEDTGNASTFKQSAAGGATYTFTATADNVTLTVGSENVFIYSIAIKKIDVTLSTRQSSQLNKKVGDNYDYFKVNVFPQSARTGNNGLFSVTSNSNTSVMNVETWGGNDDYYNYKITPGVAGTADVVLHYAGNDIYNPADLEVTFTVSKASQTLSFAESSKIISYGDATPTNALTHSVGNGTVKYSSSDTHVAEVNESTGALDIKNSGTCTITATAAETSNYLSATASYTLTVNGSTTPTITMKKGGTTVSEGATVETTYDNSIIVTGVSSLEGLTVKYRSENTSIATVDASGKIVTKNGGTVKIYVYTEGFEDINPVETYYNLVINPSSFSMTFVPNSGTINVGKTITPYVTLPSVYAEDVTEITASSDNTGIATVVTKIWDKNNPSYDYLVVKEENGKHKIERIKPTITGIAKGTTTISLTLSSSQYISSTPAIYTISVADDSDLHFDWANKSTLTMYEGDYMMMPAITGNANGYPFEQNNAQRYVWAMTQDDDHVTSLNWYNTNYHPGEGEPFYWLTDNGDGDEYNKLAYILYAESSEARTGTHPEGLMIYARKAGTVEIHAKDMQLNKELGSTITLNILPKANIYGNKDNGDESDGLLTVEQKSITYPYTWDFTRDFTAEEKTALDANSYYWTKSGVNYTNGLALQNSDYGDDNHDGTNAGSQRLYKAILANGNTIPAFKGMTVQLQGTSFDSKYGRITLIPNAGEGKSHLHVTGGPQYFQLPAPATSGTDPEKYRVYVKAKPTQSDRGEIRLVVDGNNSYWFEKAKGQFHDDGIYWAPVVRGQDIKVAFQDVDVYWIAVSTEARTLMRPENTTYAAATYSYGQDLDLIKSNEANGVTAYYASNFTVDKKDVSAGSTGSTTGEETQYAVMMKPLTSLNNGAATYVKANQGILLKKTADVGNTDCYMIANPRNVDSYSASETITGDVKNYLVGTGANSANIYGRGKDGDDDYTNFLMGYAYKYYTDVTDPNSGSEYRFDRDWSFYPLIVSGTYNLAAQRCYLKIPGNLYVDRNGNLVVMPSSSRRSAGESAEAPATKAALSIVFDDDPLTGQGTTGISTVATETTIDSDAWYTLQGVRVDVPTKGGIYIHKGRKIVVK